MLCSARAFKFLNIGRFQEHWITVRDSWDACCSYYGLITELRKPRPIIQAEKH